jgi:hypothetical protein
MTTTLAVVIAIWGLTVIAFMALMAYRAHLTQYETDQIFLESGPTHIHEEHDDIVRRIDRIGPACKVVGAAAGVMSLVLIGVWVAHMVAVAGL